MVKVLSLNDLHTLLLKSMKAVEKNNFQKVIGKQIVQKKLDEPIRC